MQHTGMRHCTSVCLYFIYTLSSDIKGLLFLTYSQPSFAMLYHAHYFYHNFLLENRKIYLILH